MASYGFTWRYSLSGNKSRWAEFKSKDTETLTKGDLMNIESGTADLAATADTDLAGVLLGTATQSVAAETRPGIITAVGSTSSGSTWLQVCIDPFAVYGVTDANSRNAGDDLDISGNTGAQTVGASSNNELRIVETKQSSSDETLVMIHPGDHYLAE